MKMPRIRNRWFAMAIAVASIAAFAESPAPAANNASETNQWTTADKNRDGMLSWEELLPFPAFSQDFDGIDANRDGKISRDEYAAWREVRLSDASSPSR